MFKSNYQKLAVGVVFSSLIITSVVTAQVSTPLTPASPQAPTKSTAQQAKLIEVARFPNAEPVGISVSKRDRVFITLPYSSYSDEKHTASVVEVMPDGTQRPYPNQVWNTKQAKVSDAPGEHFLCVQGITVDADDFLWILDTGSPKRAGVVPGGAKLVKIDLQTNKVAQVIAFNEEVVPKESYLNDVRVDARRQFAYSSETGAIGGLIVTDLRSGVSRKLPSPDLPTRTQQDNGPTRVQGGWGFPDGVTLGTRGDYLYFNATTGREFFRINTQFLRDAKLSSAAIGSLAKAVGTFVPADGIEMDTATSYIYTWDTKGKALTRFRPRGQVEVLLRDKSLKQPDGIAVGPNGYVYFTDPQFARGNGVDNTVRPFKVYKIQMPDPLPKTLPVN